MISRGASRICTTILIRDEYQTSNIAFNPNLISQRNSRWNLKIVDINMRRNGLVTNLLTQFKTKNRKISKNITQPLPIFFLKYFGIILQNFRFDIRKSDDIVMNSSYSPCNQPISL